MKLSQFQRFLSRQDIDMAFLTTPDPSITYFTQHQFSAAYLALSSRNATLFLSVLDKKPNTGAFTIKPLKKDSLKELSKEKVRTLGVNKEQLSLATLDRLKKIFPKAKIRDVGEEISRLRSQKTPQEQKYIQRACAITTRAFQELLPQLEKKKLKTEQEVAFFLEKSMREHGADIAFPSIVAFGKNSATPHHQTSQTPLRKGFLLLDFGARYKNYCADLSRMLFIGKPNPEERQRYEQLRRVQDDAVVAVKKGLPHAALEKKVRKGLGKDVSHFIHSLGHGIGIEVHEAPSFSAEKKQRIRERQVFTIEPGMYFPNKYGLRIEDTILFDGKTKVLTKATKELVIV